MTGIEAVCFDLDGTLCVPDQEIAALWAAAFEAAAIDVPFTPEDAAAVDVDGMDSVANSRREFYENVFVAAAKECDADPDPETVEAVATAYLDVHEPTAVSFRQGARAALTAATERCPVGLVTNGGASVQCGKLQTLGIREAFDAVVYCDPSEGIEQKPDPAPLERLLDELDVPPERALLVGDFLSDDIAAANAAGMRSAWVPRGSPEPDPDPSPTHVLESMEEVVELL